MKVILDEKLYDDIWDEFEKRFKFDSRSKIPFVFDMNYEIFDLNSGWDEKQEKIVNNIFKEISDDDIYALDYWHDCFEFNPKEDIPYLYNYHDNDRDVQVYFPRYYPDGDYHFFVSKDFSYGLLGHPWRKEIYVFGHKLIKGIKKKSKELNITKKSKENIRRNI